MRRGMRVAIMCHIMGYYVECGKSIRPRGIDQFEFLSSFDMHAFLLPRQPLTYAENCGHLPYELWSPVIEVVIVYHGVGIIYHEVGIVLYGSWDRRSLLVG